MNSQVLVIISSCLVVGLIVGSILFKRRPRKLKTDRFINQWRELQGLCRNKTTWPNALAEADKLLDRALKKKKFKGRSMGARLVAAQRSFTDNDDIWDAHNLTKKILASDSQIQLTQTDIKEALISYREALSDLGALPRVKRK